MIERNDTMKGFFAVFNDEIFELKELTDIYLTAQNKETGIEKIYDRTCREFKVKLNISNVDANLVTNQELYTSIVKRISEEKITSIPVLAPRYRVLIDYMLYNNSDNSVIDSGVITKMVEVNNAFLPLGLDPNTNELVYRVVKTLDGVFDFLYRSDIPFGIMKRPTEKVTLYINRVQLQQAKAHVSRLVVGEKCCNSGIVIERCNPNASTEYKYTDTFITIFDSEMEKMEIAPITTEMLPRKISINISLILNNYFYTSDPDDVLRYVQKNIDALKPTPSEPDDNTGDSDDEGNSDGNNTGSDSDSSSDTSGDNKDENSSTGDKNTGDTDNKNPDASSGAESKEESSSTTPSKDSTEPIKTEDSTVENGN